jgi:hypothetical protein
MYERRGAVLASLAVLLVAGLIGAACSRSSKSATTAPAQREAQPAETGPAGGSGSGADTGGNVSLADLGIPAISARVIKTANLALEVKQGSFEDQFQQATLIAGRHGGFVSSSKTAEASRRSGSLVLRVPADQFEAALGELKALGSVKSEELAGQDVTAQFVDLEARLRNWEAQETVLLGLMAKASTIDESIKVQRNLQDVQLAIEEIRGQVQALSDQADYSTITLAIAEAGAVPAKPEGGISIGRAWHRAVHGFVSVIAAVVIGLGYIVPVGLMALALLLGWIAYRRARARPKPVPTG